jgi:hypothetical protein
MTERSKCLVMPDDYKRHWPGEHEVTAPPTYVEQPERPSRPPFAGWTFGSFVDACRRLGLRDNDPLSGIEFGVVQAGSRCLVMSQEDEHGWSIREKLS